MIEKNVIYVDMDGTVNLFEYVGPDVWMAPGYFKNRPPQWSIIKAVISLIDKGYKVKILSSVIDDKRIEEKNEWVDKYLPQIPLEDRIYVPYGVDKSQYIKICSGDILIDDYSKNLHSWKDMEGVGIKCRNGINGKNGSWKGYSISTEQDPDIIAKTIASIYSFESLNKEDIAV